MIDARKSWPILSAAFAGLAYALAIDYVWGLYGKYHPLDAWLLEKLIPANRALYYAVIYTHDVVVNVALAYPFAILLLYIRPPAPWKYAAIALLVAFAWHYRLPLTDIASLKTLLTIPTAYIGLIFLLGSIPAALLVAIRQRGSRHVA